MATARLLLKTMNEDNSGLNSTTLANVNPNFLRGDATADAANAKKVCDALTDIVNSLTLETYESTNYQVSYSVNEEVAD